MTTKKNASSHAVSNASSKEAATPGTAGTVATASIIYIKPPPALSAIPTVPEGNQNSNGIDYVGTLPRNLELSAMPEVIAELRRFTDYTAVFGKTAPPLEFVLQTATAAGQWSGMRVKSAAWDAYARTQEGVAWSDWRSIMSSLQPALALAVATDATLARQYPSIVRLFGAKSMIAQRGATTRAVNSAAKAQGKPPARGKLAKKARRLKSAAATLAAAGETVTLPVAGAGVQVSIAATPAAGSSPVATSVSTPVTVTTGTTSAPAAATPVNGTTHS